MTDIKCPTGCDKPEDHGHYLQCQHNLMQKERSKLQSTLLQKMEKLKTHPGIKTAIIHLLNNKWKEDNQQQHNTADKIHISCAAKDQIILRNHGLEKGYISTKWRKT